MNNMERQKDMTSENEPHRTKDAQYAAGKVAQLCPNLCDPMDCNPPGSSIHEILQARILEWVAISSPGDFLDPGTQPTSPAWLADSLPLLHFGSPLVELLDG